MSNQLTASPITAGRIGTFLPVHPSTERLPLRISGDRTLSSEQVSMTLNEHHTILMSIEAGDPDRAEAITKAHILAALSSRSNDQNLWMALGEVT